MYESKTLQTLKMGGGGSSKLPAAIVIIIYFTFQRSMIGNKTFGYKARHCTNYNSPSYIKIRGLG